MWLAAGTMNFDLEEVDSQGRRIVHESGWLPGVELGAAATRGRAQLRLQASYYDGDVDYDGQTQAQVPINSSTDQTIWDAGLTAAWRLAVDVVPEFNIYAGINYHYWRRHIQPVGAILGLEETYRWWSPRAGLEIAWQRARDRWMLSGELTRTLNPEVDIDAFATFDSTTLDLGERWGWRGAIGWQHELSPHIAAGIKLFYETWSLGRSDAAILTSNQVPVGTISQPHIDNRNYGVTIELRRRW